MDVNEILNKIICGNTLSVLRTLPSEFIDCVITSPPYWQLRDYDLEPQIWDGDVICKHEWEKSSFCIKCGAWRGSLGLEPDFNLYIKHLCDIFDEVKRVLKATGTVWVNIGDTFSRSGGGGKVQVNHVNFGEVPKVNKQTANTIPHSVKNYPRKCGCLIPERFSIEMVNRGWTRRRDIIWEKPNCLPQSVKDAFTINYEHIYFFTKAEQYYFKQIFEPLNPDTYRRSKHGHTSKKREVLAGGGLYNENAIKYADKLLKGGYEGRNKRCVWSIAVSSFDGSHFATFPKELVKIPIEAGCPEGGIVLDPFMGSGTTAVVAREMGRNFIGIELNSEYIEIATSRMGKYLF